MGVLAGNLKLKLPTLLSVENPRPDCRTLEEDITPQDRNNLRLYRDSTNIGIAVILDMGGL